MEKIRSTKYNEWFRKTFLESFGTCEHKSISEKQGLIFERYLKEEPENWRHANAFFYSGIIDGKCVRLQESSVYNGSAYGCNGRKTLYRTVYSVTIKPDNTDKIKELSIIIDKLEKQWDAAFESGASDEELDNLENEIDKLTAEREKLWF